MYAGYMLNRQPLPFVQPSSNGLFPRVTYVANEKFHFLKSFPVQHGTGKLNRIKTVFAVYKINREYLKIPDNPSI